MDNKDKTPREIFAEKYGLKKPFGIKLDKNKKIVIDENLVSEDDIQKLTEHSRIKKGDWNKVNDKHQKIKDYNQDADFYYHEKSKQWLLKHDACERIHGIEKMSSPIVKVETDENDKGTFLLITVKHGDLEWTDVGEATPKNCISTYYRSMAFKRGLDRCILKLLKAYELFYSDAEIERTISPQKTNKQQESENDLDNHGK